MGSKLLQRAAALPRATGRLLVRLLRTEQRALPVDVFRVAASVLAFAYFLSLARDVELISSPDGFLDHEALRALYPFTMLSLFVPGMSAFAFTCVYVGAAGLSAVMALGIAPRVVASVLFAIAVSAYRWNFAVIFVDDSVMHLLLLWLVLLPTGRTLSLPEVWRRREVPWNEWLDARVPGAAIVAFLANVLLLYEVAGLSKVWVPMWRDGYALYAVLRLPIARLPTAVTPDDLWWLEPLSHASLLVEVIAPLALLARNVRVRALAAASLVGFHAGIVLALPIPFANIALVAALVFFFRDELMSWLARGRALPPLEVASRIATRGRLSVALVVTLGVAHLRLVPGVSYVSMAAYGVLWGAGLAQDYHLFNWISTVNYSIENRVTVEPLELVDGAAPHDVDPTLLFPRSLRMALVQTYLHDVKWAYASKSDRVAIKRMILPRAARRFCRTTGIEGRVRLTSRVQRITRASPVPDKGALSRNMLVFTCAAGEAHVEHMNVKVLTNKELRRAARRARR